MDDTLFLGRNREMDRLSGLLSKAVAGQGQVVFISGEAGSGKTALALEFARRAQARQASLVVAVGDCNAQTGLGDPYLPFREVLAQLFGDVDAKLAQGEISRENVRRIRALLVHAGQVLVELGPDLVNIVIPGSRIVGALGKTVAQKFGWLDAFEKLARDKRNAPVLERPALEQNQICEQYARVMRGLAAQQPLLLILDDAQWADAASVGLLFHLSRRISDSPIMIVVTYRPDEVFSERAEPHPLQKVLAELKRYHGDMTIDLDQPDPLAGRQLFDGLLDFEPNDLGAAFRRELFARTEGQPLFTIELLRNLQERGDLVRNDAGRWVEGPHLDWRALPARVEGVAEARLSQLDEDTRDLLRIASVEGIDFTVQVVAAVHGRAESDVLHTLANGLSRQRRIVSERGMFKVGEHMLFRYGFLHRLFQSYIYEQLAAAQRVMLHSAIGDRLEALYGERAPEIAPQLARHFSAAQRDDKALVYLTLAADAAARSYANSDAISYYKQALDIARRSSVSSDEIMSLYVRCGRALELDGKMEQALSHYEEMHTVGLQRGDRALELAAAIAKAVNLAIPSHQNDAAQARRLFDHALVIAHDLDDRKAESKILWGLMLLEMYGGDARQGIRYGEQSLTLARQLALREHMAYVLNDISALYGMSGDQERSAIAREEAHQLWLALGNTPMLAYLLSGFGISQFFAGHLEHSLELGAEGYRLAKSIGQTWGMAHAQFFEGRVYTEQGEPAQAIAAMKAAISLSELPWHAGVNLTNRGDLAWTYANLGAMDQAIQTAQVLAGDERFWGMPVRVAPHMILARIHLLRGDLAAADGAQQAIDRAVELDGIYTSVAAEVALLDAELAVAHRDPLRALAVLNGLQELLRTRGFRVYFSDALYVRGQVLLQQGLVDEAHAALSEARAIAEAIGSRRMLWPVLTILGDIEEQRGNPALCQTLHAQARMVIDYIADHAGSPQLRASFLARPQVQAALS